MPTMSYTVRKGIGNVLMTKAVSSFAEAEAHAIRLSKNVTFTVQVWHEQKLLADYYKGEKISDKQTAYQGGGRNQRAAYP